MHTLQWPFVDQQDQYFNRNNHKHTRVTTNNKTYDYDDEPVMTMKTFDEILTEKGYHAEYYGKWHVLTSHSEVYKNQINMLKMVNICLNMEAQSYMYQDYLNDVFPKREPQKGELLDNFTKRPYTPDPLDVNYGKTYAEVKKENKKFLENRFLNADGQFQKNTPSLLFMPKRP